MASRSGNIVILGGGESGVGAAILAQKKGFDVLVSDNGTLKEKYKKDLDAYAIEWEENGHSLDRVFQATEVIKSPGIPDTIALIKDLREKQIPVVSEIEFAARYTKATKVCITGSNGKTTTTLMTYHLLKKAGLNVAVCGNVGESFARLVAEEEHDYYVIELSSFQLDGMYEFKAEIAILLNITPDHLDRYDYSMDKYAESKFRIIQNQTERDFFIFNNDDELIVNKINNKQIRAQQYPFSLEQQLEKGGWLDNEQQINILTNNKQQQTTMSIHELAQQGKHNAYNSMASGITGSILKIRKEIVRESLSDFQNIEHRLEPVVAVHGIEFINDSKATNVNSTWYALESMDKPTIWIAGGVDKGNDYTMLHALVKQKVRGIVCLGKDNTKLREAFGDIIEDIYDATSAQEAVGLSYRLAKKGYNVLLSPACASFDLFENYEDRGNQFKKAVRML
ncbi:MAG: UDP-N-acetylmuramoyl-L-alanine--D-glutamate ligase [Flavobacteriales bacterium]|nr:UDP-N-acetylmuramoyl-L-alanine--D-glutamate ligase [Flavobacteriales bacterium]